MTRRLFRALVAGAILLGAALPSGAQPLRFDPSVVEAAAPMLTEIRFRGGRGGHRVSGGRHGGHGGGFRPGGHRPGGHHGFRPGGHHGGFRPGGPYGGHGYGRPYRRGYGAAIGAGVAGLAAGAVIGGALAQPAYGIDPGYTYPVAVPTDDATAACARRFKSYDPASGTYLGYDGLRHPCP